MNLLRNPVIEAITSYCTVPGCILVIIASLAFAKLLITIHNANFHLTEFPGPPGAAFSRLWLLYALWSERSHELYESVALKYGPLARIGPNHLLVSDPEALRKILDTKSLYERGTWFDFLLLNPFQRNLITEPDRTLHNRLRAKMASGFNGKGIPNFEASIDETLQQWLAYVQKNGVSSKGVTKGFDIATSCQWLMYDMFSALMFGKPVGFVEKHTDLYYFQATLEERLPMIEKLSIFGSVRMLLKIMSYTPFLKKNLPNPDQQEGVGAIQGLVRDAMNARIASGEQEKDILGTWLREDIPRDQLINEIVIALFTGSDTTATSMRALTLHVISHPRVYARLQAEIISFTSAGPVISEQEVKKLPYLQACILEGLRMFPPVVFLRERTVPEGGDMLCGKFVPGGTQVGMGVPGLLRNKIFGEDVHVFRPERWLEATEARRRDMERVHELMFGWGFTRCLGVRMANMAIAKFIFEILRRWDISMIHPQKPWNSANHGIFVQHDFDVRIVPRGSEDLDLS